MKKLLFIFSMLCLTLVLCFGFAQAQETESQPNLLFVGVSESVDTDLGNSTSITAGYGMAYKQDSRFWFLPNFKVGTGGAPSDMNPESVIFLKRSDKLYAGLLLGPNFDIQTVDKESSAVTYLTGAGGVLVVYDFKPDIGAWIYGKYKTQFGIESAYKDGYDIGIGIHFRLNT